MSRAEVKFVIPLPPVSKKNSQQILMNKSTGRPFIMPSAKFKQYEREAAWFLKPRPPRPIDCALAIKCLFYMPTRRRVDLTNLLEAIDDILVGAGIIADDHSGIVVSHDGSRVLYDKDNPRTEVTITRLDTDHQMMMDEMKG